MVNRARLQQDQGLAEREAILEAMFGNTEKAPEPGTLRVKDIIHNGDPTDEFPAPVIASALKSAGYTFVYDTRTGDRSVCNNNMLGAQLQKRRDDGSLAFSRTPPVDEQGKVITPKPGTFRCYLHPDERKPEYDDWHLPTCRKANLVSQQDRLDHMRHRHQREWKTIEADRAERDKQAEVERQERLYLAIAGRAAEQEAAKKTGKAS